MREIDDTRPAPATTSEELHRQVFERNLAVQLLIDPASGRILEANPAASRFYGYTRDQLTSMNIGDINMLRPDEVRRALDGATVEKRNTFTFPHRLASGEVRQVEVHSGPIDVGGRRLLYSIIHDVTDRQRVQRALEDSEASFRLLFANHPLPMWVYEYDELRFLEVNEAATQTYHYSRDEFLGMRITDIRPPGDVPTFLEQLTRNRGRGPNAPWPHHTRHRRRDGSVLEVEVVSHELSFGARKAVLVVAQDVTARQQALEALQRSEEKYRAILGGIEEGYYEVDLDGVLTFANEALAQAVGRPAGELPGTRFDALVDDDTVGLLRLRFREVLTSGLPLRNLRFEISRADGRHRVVEGSVALLRDAGGAPSGFRGVLADVTEREHRDAELRESEERFRRLVEMSPDGIAIYSEGRVVFCNTAGARLVGARSPEDVVGRPLDDFVHPDSRALTRARMETLGRGQSVPFVELKYLSLAGEPIEVEAAASPFTYQDRPAAQVVVRDIRDRKRAERLQKALYRIAQTSSSGDDMSAFYAAIHAIVAELMYARNFFIALQDPGTGAFTFEYFVDEEDPVPPPINAGKSLTQYVMRTGEPLLATEETCAVLEARGEIELLGAPSIDWMGVPLRRERDCFGVLVLQTYTEARRYTPADLDVLTFVSQHVATAIDRRRAAAALRESEERFRTLAETAPCAIFIYQGERFRYANPAMSQISGYGRDELMDTNFWTIVHPGYRDIIRDRGLARQRGEEVPNSYEFQIVRKDGEVRWVQFSAGVVDLDGQPAGLGTAFDVTERKRAEEQIKSLAYHDALTGLPNRLLFHDRLTVAVAQAHRTSQRLAVLFLDVDRFKLINDSLGHSFGDLLLQEVARRVQETVREGDTVARLGGDEFTLLLPGIQRTVDAAKVAEKILESLKQSVRVQDRELFVTASVGISVYPEDGSDAEGLIKNADTAMYRAKEQGRDNYQLYTPAMNATAVERLALESNLRKALAQDELLLYYQPLLDLATGRVHGVEALLRWRHPERGLVSPAEFIPIAEVTGLILPIGAWTLRAACAQAKKWQQGGHPNLTVAVNLSARQFTQPDLREQVRRALDESGLPPRSLDLEITESNAMQNAESTILTLRDLKVVGVRVSIDDFGIGYSSLSYLKRLPIDTLKIDQSFVRDITTDPDDAAIATAVIALAHTLKLKVVGEGVETEEQLAFLTARHCDRMQGYLYSRPLPPDECEQFLARNRPF